MSRQTALGLSVGFLVACIWAGYNIVARFGVTGGFDPFDLTALRIGTAALVLLPLAWRERAAIRGLGLGRLAALAICAGPPYILVYTGGLVFAPAVHAGTITPISIAVLSAALAIPLLHEKPEPRRVLALGIMALGVVAIGWDGIHGAHPGAWRGIPFFVLCGGMWALFTVLLHRWSINAVTATVGLTLFAALLYLPPYFAWRGETLFAHPWHQLLLQAVFQGVLTGALATLLYAHAAKLLGATLAATIPALVPGLTLLLARIVLDEPFDISQLIGITLATGALLFAVLATGKR